MSRATSTEPRIATSRPAVYLVRAAAAHLRGFITGETPQRVASDLFGDSVTDIVLRSATTQAAVSGTSAWAASIAGVAVYDLVQSVTSISAAADLIGRAMKLNMDGIAEQRVPGRTLVAGTWVGEGMAAPVKALTFANDAILRPRKLQVLTTYSRELAEHSNIEAVVRQTLGESCALSLDLQMLSNDAGGSDRPPGLFNGVTPITATTGGGDAAMHGDIAALFAALASKGGGKSAVIVAAMPQAVRLKLVAGPKFDHDILESTALAAGTVAVIEAASLVSGFGSTAEFSTSKVGVVHAEDTTPADISGAVPVKSLYQIDAIGLRTTLFAAWARAAGHAQFLTGATW
jgi:hypothetical protein